MITTRCWCGSSVTSDGEILYFQHMSDGTHLVGVSSSCVLSGKNALSPRKNQPSYAKAVKERDAVICELKERIEELLDVINGLEGSD